jgi:nucleotide-binding universal stress UspA family protein
MSGIVCAIRGGAASQPTIKMAIQTAQKTDLPIYFLYVVNIDFLLHTSHSRIQTIVRELSELGDFILLTAQSKAEGFGVKAESILREGNVGDEIIELCREIKADYVILGRPQAVQDENVFTHDLISEFGQQIETETGAKAIFPEGDET